MKEQTIKSVREEEWTLKQHLGFWVIVIIFFMFIFLMLQYAIIPMRDNFNRNYRNDYINNTDNQNYSINGNGSYQGKLWFEYREEPSYFLTKDYNKELDKPKMFVYCPNSSNDIYYYDTIQYQQLCFIHEGYLDIQYMKDNNLCLRKLNKFIGDC